MILRNKHFDMDDVRNRNRPVINSMILLSSLIMALTAYANAAETPNLVEPKIVVPEKIAGVATLKAEQVFEKLTSDNAPVLIDARIEKDREYGFIENSISLPDIKTNCDTLKEVVADKKLPLIFYCNGVQCGRSLVSIKVARSCGYHNLSWFKGGFAEWREKGYQYLKKRKIR